MNRKKPAAELNRSEGDSRPARSGACDADGNVRHIPAVAVRAMHTLGARGQRDLVPRSAFHHPDTLPEPRMIRTSLLVGVLLAGTAVPATAQGDISPGQTAQGELSTEDAMLEDGSHYDVWRFQTHAGHVYAVTLRSDDFDAFLAVGPSFDSECGDCRMDDDDGGGTNARVVYRASAAGTLQARANSLSGNETGVYTIQVEDLGEREESSASTAPTPVGREPVRAELTEDDAVARDDSYYDVYVYEGRAGESITVTMRSDDFDTFLSIGHQSGDQFREIASNDDGWEGTNAEVSVTFTEDGPYFIRANALIAGETGAYILEITGT